MGDAGRFARARVLLEERETESRRYNATHGSMPRLTTSLTRVETRKMCTLSGSKPGREGAR